MARVSGMDFLASRYVPPEREAQRLRELEKYVARQSVELYLALTRLEKKLALLEVKLSQLEASR